MFIDVITFIEVFAVKNFGKVLKVIFFPVKLLKTIVTNPFAIYHF